MRGNGNQAKPRTLLVMGASGVMLVLRHRQWVAVWKVHGFVEHICDHCILNTEAFVPRPAVAEGAVIPILLEAHKRLYWRSRS